MNDNSKQQLQELLSVLEEKTKAENENRAPSFQPKSDKPSETVSDDFELDTAKKESILRDEFLVRQVLALFNIDYNSLICMKDADGNPSVYARAVKGKPQLLEQVKKAKYPVLAALNIAVKFKPYADFMGKYGEKPDEIYKAIKAELETRKGADIKTEDTKNQADALKATAFSSLGASGTGAAASSKEKSTLSQYFPK